ncbi:hypothetical protein GCM10009530_39870 [Microbispora corallina]|uniref:Uncharacterized protein n=1 Tax=Microbispora corallina TaxID=83302 RepID=A0ABQ4G8U3_9ACTN|nr:hypothetical protein Mco01_64600 [Microbispora corallina]
MISPRPGKMPTTSVRPFAFWTVVGPTVPCQGWLDGLLADIGIPTTLADIGVARADPPRFAEMASGVTRLIQNHPGPTDTASLTAILEAALIGDRTRHVLTSEQRW